MYSAGLRKGAKVAGEAKNKVMKASSIWKEADEKFLLGDTEGSLGEKWHVEKVKEAAFYWRERKLKTKRSAQIGVQQTQLPIEREKKSSTTI